MIHDWSKEDYAEYRRAAVRKSQRFRREIAKGNGLCSICCRNKARDNRVTCAECSAKISQRNKRRRERMRGDVND